MALKIPPLAVGAAAAALMWLVAGAVPAAEMAYPGPLPAALALALIGFIVAALGTVSFSRAGTTVNPMQPENASALVVSGIYRYTRNPMYLGLLIMLLGWAAWLANIVALLTLSVYVVYMNRYQIQPEEEALERLFGEEYKRYKMKVRRWL